MRGLASLGAVVLVFVAGCSAAPLEAPRTPPADARPTEICVLRVGSAGGEATYVVRDNGKLVATVGQGYFCYGAPPGAHHVVVEVGPSSAAVEVTLAAGERVFLQQSLSSEGVALARLSEAAAVGDGASASKPAAPSPGAAAAADAKPLPPPSPPPPFTVRRRPEGLVYGIDAGVGLGSSRTVPATQTTASFAALGSILIGIWPTDYLMVAGRIDAMLVNGDGLADFAVHLRLFPLAESSGSLRNFALFADAGAAVPISGSSGLSTAPPIAGMARIGVGVQRWKIGPALVGPLLCGQIVRATGEADAAVLGGLTGSLDSQAPRK